MAIQFPNSPGIGSVFTDTDAGFSYEWTGVVWKSFTPAAANNIKELDDISSSFNNSTTTFNLTINGIAYQPRSAAMLQISLGGIIQEPNTDYTISLDTITFTTAPSSGLDFFGVVRGTAVGIDFANDGNVQTKQEFTATLGQTSFTVTGGYTQGYVDVFRNGVRLGSDDFTDTSETAIVLTVPAQADDLIEVVKYNVASIVVSQGEFTNLNVSGIVTASSFKGALTGNVTGNVSGSSGSATGNAGGLTGSPTIAITNLTGVAATFTGNVSIGGTLSYLDVTNIDSVGIITAQKGLQVLANGVDVTGIGTFEDRITYDGSIGQAGGAKITYAVTVATKDATHRYNGSGSSNGYVIDNLQAPVLTLTPGRTYFFDQSDSSNSSHPLRFYLEADKTTSYTTNVTAGSISAGTAGAGVTIVIGDSTPNVLHYQCSSHGYMGNSVISQSNIAGGAIGDFTIDDKIIHTGDTDTAVRFPAANTITAETAGTEALRIDSSGRVLVKLGSSITSEAGEAHTPALQVAHVGGNLTNLGISVSRFQASNPNSVPIILQKSRNSTIGSHTIVENNDALGRVEFAGSDGAKFVTAASIIADVDGAPGTDDMPGRLQFMTTADGASQPTERLRITAAGLVRVPDSGKLTLGSGDDLQIYHNGSHSFIADASGTGNLYINSSKLVITDSGDTETMANFIENGAVELFHNGVKKLETSSDGITVTGTVTDSIGSLRRLGTNTQSGDYTLVAGDAGKVIIRTGGNVTVPNGVFSAGDMVSIVNNAASDMTVTQGSSLTLYNTADSSTGSVTQADRSTSTVLFVSSSIAYISGTQLS